jgi:hypothetical protein
MTNCCVTFSSLTYYNNQQKSIGVLASLAQKALTEVLLKTHATCLTLPKTSIKR